MNDELFIFRGNDFIIQEHLTIHQPTLDEICCYGEHAYYSMVNTLTATPADLKWQLADMGIDYTQVEEFELFYSFLCRGYPQEKTAILFGDLDLTKLVLVNDPEENKICLINPSRDIRIDNGIYQLMADYLRKLHCLKKNEQKPANESTRQILIEDAREEYQRNRCRKSESQLLNLISSMVNCEGFKYNHTQVWDMKINAFMDSVRRISKIKNADLLLQSGYSGFGINLKEISKKQIDWLGGLDDF